MKSLLVAWILSSILAVVPRLPDEGAGSIPAVPSAQDQAAEVETLLADVAKKLQRIDRGLARYATREKRPRELFATRTTLRLFLKYVREDLDAGILDLALKEAREIDFMADRALARLKEKNLPLSRERSVRNLAIEDGSFVNEAGEPVYLLGFHYSSTHPHLTYGMKKDLGINLETLAVWVGGEQVRRTAKGDYTVDLEGSFGRGGRWGDERLAERMGHNIVTDHLWCLDQGVPEWFFELYPESRVPGNHFCPYDPDHPEVRKLNRARVAAFMERYAAKKSPVVRNSVGWCLWNEPDLGSVTVHTRRDFRTYVREEYGEIEALNGLWKTEYGGFDEVNVEVGRQRESRIAFYDWCIFNRLRFHGHMKEMRDTIQEQARGKTFNTHIKLMSGMWHPDRFHVGIDHELLLDVQDINGCDCWIGPSENGKYGLHWQHQSRTYDFLHSIGPEHPIHDSEWHAADSEACTEAQMRAAVWLGAWHGRSGSDLWCLSRDRSSYLYWDVAASGHEYPYRRIETMPLVFEAYAQEGIRVGGQMERIRTFARTERPVCIYYSVPSGIYDPEHMKSLAAVYEAFHFQDVPVGFVTERMFEEKRLRPEGVKLIVVPHARHVSDQALEHFQELDRGGTKILFVGDGNLTRDTKDRIREPGPAWENALQWEDGDAEAHRAKAGRVLEGAGIEKRFSIRPVGGGGSLPVEARFAEYDGAVVGYAINLGRETVAFTIVDARGRTVRIRGVFGRKGEEARSTVTLESLEFLNFDVVAE